jgi:hypothetical protein
VPALKEFADNAAQALSTAPVYLRPNRRLRLTESGDRASKELLPTFNARVHNIDTKVIAETPANQLLIIRRDHRDHRCAEKQRLPCG